MSHGIHYAIIISANLHYILAMGNLKPYRQSREPAMNLDSGTQTNLTVESNDNSVTNTTQDRADADQFWLLRDEGTTTNLPDIIETEFQMGVTKSPKPVLNDDPEWIKEYEMNELLFLSRNNCNLELLINEWEDRKLKIQYEKLKKGMTGQCQISLYGKNGISLAVLVSSVQLNGKRSRQMREEPTEVLRVVTRSHHLDYILREYDGNEGYYPVILTESDRVFLILMFNGTNPNPARSSYNLEVFNYYKNEKNITLYDDINHGSGNSTQNIDNVHITTMEP